jgi:hypothetical protein
MALKPNWQDDVEHLHKNGKPLAYNTGLSSELLFSLLSYT